MSSWYVLSALGIYSYAPGSDVYLLGKPLFDEASIRLENGEQFTIKAENALVGNAYVQGLELNGVELDRNYIYHREIMNGGELVFNMGATPAKTGLFQHQKLLRKMALYLPLFL